MRARPLLAVLALALALGAPAAAQDSRVSYVARLTSGLAKLGETLAVVVEVTNDPQAEVLRAPRADGLEIGRVSEASSREEMSIMGGRVSRTFSKTWRIPVRPLRTGEFELPGVELLVGGERVTAPALTLTVVEDLQGAELGFFDVKGPEGPLVEGQPFELELLFGWDEALGNRVDYANLIVPWWGKLPELLELEHEKTLGGREQEISFNSRGSIVVEELPPFERDGRRVRAFRLRRAFLATRPASVELTRPFLEFGQREQRDILGGRRRSGEAYYVPGAPLTLAVRRLPTEGQPLDYTGAIGALALRASAEPRDVDVGDSIKVTLTITGDGNNQFFDPPDPTRDEAFQGFKSFGVATKSKSLHRSEYVYDLAPLSEAVDEIPPLRLSVYDPAQGAYVSVASEPIPIRVRPLEGAVTLEGGGEDARLAKDVADIAPALPPPAEALPAPTPGALALLAAGTLLGWLALRREVRRRRGDPDAPLERRRRRALKVLSRDLASAADPIEELRALQVFLAARTREPEQAWVGRDPRELAPAAADEGRDLAQAAGELAAAVERLERAAYAARTNGDGRPPKAELLSLADRLVKGGL